MARYWVWRWSRRPRGGVTPRNAPLQRRGGTVTPRSGGSSSGADRVWQPHRARALTAGPGGRTRWAPHDMLRALQVRDLAIIDEVEVSFGMGLNIVTGETGAGKSILIDALGLVSVSYTHLTLPTNREV